MRTATSLAVCLLLYSAAIAQPIQLPSNAEIDELIVKLQSRLFEMQVDKWALTRLDPEQETHPFGFPTNPAPTFGAVVEQNKGTITFLTDAGKRLEIPLSQIYGLQAPGHFQPDYYQMGNPGGYSWIACWALIASGMEESDPRMQKVLRFMIESRQPHGVYSLSLRMNACSLLLRRNRAKPDPAIKKMLADDTEAMIHGALLHGDYGYEVAPYSKQADGDNSNTQFAVYGLWAAEQAGMIVPRRLMMTLDDFWRKHQLANGGWAYSSGLPQESPSMTEAGANTLYILLDQLWGRPEGASYTPASGMRYQRDAAAGIKLSIECLDRAWTRIDATLLPATDTQPYRLYGLQRLGIASGRKRIGPDGWFDRIIRELYKGGAVDPQESIETLSWRLLCLSFGRHPVIFNKLQVGSDESHWNYYFRDVANLTQWINRQTESQHNWQIVSLKNELHDLQDSPILIICTDEELSFDEPEGAKLKRYCDLGGTVLITPLHNSNLVKQSAKKLFHKLYPEYEFRNLPPTHPIFASIQRGGATRRIPRVAMRALSDGGRDFAFIADGDIAGAWQLRSGVASRDEDLHEMMFNLRFYAAPPYAELNSPLRRDLPANPRSGTRIRVARLKQKGVTTCCKLLYEAIDPYLASQAQCLDARLDVAPTNDLLRDVDVIHVTSPFEYSFTSSEVDAIRDAIAQGAYVIVDPTYGLRPAAVSGQALIDKLGLEVRALGLKAAGPQQDVSSRDFNEWSNPEMLRAFSALHLNGKLVGFLANVDITAAATGVHVYGHPGLSTRGARQLWCNLFAQAKGTLPAPSTSTSAPTTSSAPK